MYQTKVRIQSIQLQNFKNITKGEIALTPPKLPNNEMSVTGIYGQNGSGKTSVVCALELFQTLLSGGQVSEDICLEDYIQQHQQATTVTVRLTVLEREQEYLVEHTYSIAHRGKGGVYLLSESVRFRNVTGKGWFTAVAFQADEQQGYEKKNAFTPIDTFRKVVNGKRVTREKLFFANRSLQKAEHVSSFAFHEDVLKAFKESKEVQEHSMILQALQNFARGDMMVASSGRRYDPNEQFLHVAYHKEVGDMLMAGTLQIPIGTDFSISAGPSDVDEAMMLNNIIDHLNIVLCTLVPGLSIALRTLKSEVNEQGEEVKRYQLYSQRGDIYLPLRNESEGILRIVSILGAMIAAYWLPTYCLVVDEIDAGIFEYLLGDLLSILHDKGKGQLIFTAHNLRPLEKLPSECIAFSTANPENRFIKLSGVKKNNNLRDTYLRKIVLGGTDEPLYEATSRYDIAAAMQEAGKSIGREVFETDG